MTTIINQALYAAWLPVFALGAGYWAHAAWQQVCKWRRP